MKAVALTLAATLAASSLAFADTGLKNKKHLADRQDAVTEGQILCEEEGVQTVVIKDESGEITIACDKLAPETSPAPTVP